MPDFKATLPCKFWRDTKVEEQAFLVSFAVFGNEAVQLPCLHCLLQSLEIFLFQTIFILILILVADNMVLQIVTRTSAVCAGMWQYHDDSGHIVSCIMEAPENSSDVSCLLQLAVVISCGWTCNEDRGHSLSCHMFRCNMTYVNQTH